MILLIIISLVVNAEYLSYLLNNSIIFFLNIELSYSSFIVFSKIQQRLE